jgi:hypothetical protein
MGKSPFPAPPAGGSGHFRWLARGRGLVLDHRRLPLAGQPVQADLFPQAGVDLVNAVGQGGEAAGQAVAGAGKGRSTRTRSAYRGLDDAFGLAMGLPARADLTYGPRGWSMHVLEAPLAG